jgi:hypothetical protein
MSVCVFSVFDLSCVQVAALRWADQPIPGVLPTVYKIKVLKKRPTPKKRAVDNICRPK